MHSWCQSRGHIQKIRQKKQGASQDRERVYGSRNKQAGKESGSGCKVRVQDQEQDQAQDAECRNTGQRHMNTGRT